MPRQLNIPWYRAFVECTLPHTEAPKNYLFWSAISVLGGILKNNVHYKDSLYTLYPNQFIVLAGPPGIGKGTAINFAWKLIKTQSLPLANILNGDRITGPKMLHVISEGWNGPVRLVGQGAIATKDHTCTIIATELQNLINGGDDMLPTFCQLWDQDEYQYRTKNQGDAVIKGMCVSLLGASFPDYIRSMGQGINAAIVGGFTARCLFIMEDKKSKEQPDLPPIEDDPKSMSLYLKLKDDLEHISKNVRGEFKKDDEARIVFSNFYPRLSPLADDTDATLNFKARMRAHIWKLAMILSAARKDRLVIEGQDIKDAIFLINAIKQQIDKIFRGAGASQLAEPTARVQEVIERFGMLTKHELLKATTRHMDPDTLDKVLHVLEIVGYCITRRIGNKIYYQQAPKQAQVSVQGNIP